MNAPGPDPIKHSSVELDSTLENWPIREAKIRHVTDLMVWFQHWVKCCAGIFYMGSGPGLPKCIFVTDFFAVMEKRRNQRLIYFSPKYIEDFRVPPPHFVGWVQRDPVSRLVLGQEVFFCPGVRPLLQRCPRIWHSRKQNSISISLSLELNQSNLTIFQFYCLMLKPIKIMLTLPSLSIPT